MQDAVTNSIIKRVIASFQTTSSSSEEDVALELEAAFPFSSHKEKSEVRKADKGTAL